MAIDPKHILRENDEPVLAEAFDLEVEREDGMPIVVWALGARLTDQMAERFRERAREQITAMAKLMGEDEPPEEVFESVDEAFDNGAMMGVGAPVEMVMN